jgi:hypothetical protein
VHEHCWFEAVQLTKRYASVPCVQDVTFRLQALPQNHLQVEIRQYFQWFEPQLDKPVRKFCRTPELIDNAGSVSA